MTAVSELEFINGPTYLIALIVRTTYEPFQTAFLTENDANLQLGFVVYPAGGEIVPHVHHPIERATSGTAEVLVVKSGRCEIDFYSEDKNLVATREISAGDVTLLLRGGHGFRLIEDTVFLEVKQGPYAGISEKERFEPK